MCYNFMASILEQKNYTLTRIQRQLQHLLYFEYCIYTTCTLLFGEWRALTIRALLCSSINEKLCKWKETKRKFRSAVVKQKRRDEEKLFYHVFRFCWFLYLAQPRFELFLQHKLLVLLAKLPIPISKKKINLKSTHNKIKFKWSSRKTCSHKKVNKE